MPGIVGIFSRGDPALCRHLLDEMLSSMQHESFYCSGTHYVPELGVYGGWVAHKGSMAANQVFRNEGNEITLLISGECFSDQETACDLKYKGHVLEGCAGDWIVHQYEELGERFFSSLNGLFSGLLIDRKSKSAFLFNDRYGMERIYWHESNNTIFFASEAKALLRVVPELRLFDETGVEQFLTYGCTLGTRTLFHGVHTTSGGTLWKFNEQGCVRDCYFSPKEWESLPSISDCEFENRIEERLDRILPNYFSSDSQVGVSLTGGLDTRMIMACLPDFDRNPVCYTFADSVGDTIDARLASIVASKCGLDHCLLRIEKDFIDDFLYYADRTVYLTDGCFGYLGAHEIYMNNKARFLAPVRVTGNYGSEVLRGMSTFRPLGLATELFVSEYRYDRIKREVNSSAPRHPVTLAAFEEIPWNLFGNYAAGRSQLTFRTPYLDNEIVSLAFQAPEDSRVTPLTSMRLVNRKNRDLSRIPTDRGLTGDSLKGVALLRHVMCQIAFKIEYHTNEGLPHWLVRLDPWIQNINIGARYFGRHKFLHYRRWFRRELAEQLFERIDEVEKIDVPYLNSGFFRSMIRHHIEGKRNYTREIDAVFTLSSVAKHILGGGMLK